MYRRRSMVNWVEKQFKMAKKSCPEALQKIMTDYVNGRPVRQRLLTEAGKYISGLKYGHWIMAYNQNKLAAKKGQGKVKPAAPPPAAKKPGKETNKEASKKAAPLKQAA